MGFSDAIRKLTTVWSFEADDSAVDDLEKKLGGLKSTALAVGASIAAAAGTLYGFAEVTASAARAAGKISQQLGLTADAYQRLAFAAEHSGADAEDLGVALKMLSRQAYEASTQGGESAKNFIRLGLNIRDANGKIAPADELLFRLSDKFSKMPDGIEKTAIATQFFGRSGNMLIPMLNKGRETLTGFGDEAAEMGLILDGDTIKASKRFGRALKDIHEQALSVTYAVGKTLIPVIADLLEHWKQILSQNHEALIGRITALTRSLTLYLKIVWQFVTAIVGAGRAFINLIGGFDRVVTIFAVLAGIFAGASLLYGIGAVAVALYGLISAFSLLNVMVAISEVLMALPFILGGVAVVAFLLLLEDIYTFFTGGDSIAGVFVDGFKDAFNWLSGQFEQLGTWGKAFVTILETPIRAVVATVRTLIELFRMLPGMGGSAAEAASTFAGGLASIAGFTPQGGAVGTTLSGALGFGSYSNPAMGSGGNSTTSTQANVTVNVGDGADPIAIGQAARDGTSKGIGDAQRREAARAFKGTEGAH